MTTLDLDRLDPDTRDFFVHHFFADALKSTRASIARRIHSLTAIPAFRRMFTASANSLDLFAEMQKMMRTLSGGRIPGLGSGLGALLGR